MLLPLFSFLFLCFSFSACVGTCVPAKFELGSLVCGIVVDHFSGWGGGMTATSGCFDARDVEVDAVAANGCGGACFESGGCGGCYS